MARPAKFLFDSDFGAPAARPQGVSPAEQEARLAEAEAAAYRRGFADAEAAAHASLARQQAAAAQAIADGLAQLRHGLAEVQARLEAEAAILAVAIARKLAPALIAREPAAEIAALAADCFRHLVAAPHLVVRVGEGLLDTARAALDAIARNSGFEGRLVVLADPDLADGDCRIEWADGGISRRRADTEAQIESLVRRYVAARSGTGEPVPAASPLPERTTP